MTIEDIEKAAKKQQELTGRPDATVTFLIPGKWPKSGKKQLFRGMSLVGDCVNEERNAVLVAFRADEVLATCAKF